MNGQQAYKILTNMELYDPFVYRYGKRIAHTSVVRVCCYGRISYEAVTTSRDNDPQQEIYRDIKDYELMDYLCQWDDDEWYASTSTLRDMEAKGIDV